MIEITLSSIAFTLLFIPLIFQIIYLIKEKYADPFSHFVLFMSFILLFTCTIIRSININFIAITNTFEGIVLFSQFILILLFIYRLKSKDKTIPFIMFGGTLIVIIFLAIASSPILPKEIKPPIPALQSYWLVLHVVFAFIGEAFFVIGFVASIYYLSIKNEEKRKKADRLTYISITIGYLLFTTGALIFGAIWAEQAWGSYWSWDPKETWAFITWLIYTVYLHLRLVHKQKGRVTAVISIIGFIFTIFTFFGVNFLLISLHSYR